MDGARLMKKATVRSLMFSLLCSLASSSVADDFAITSQPHLQIDLNMRALQASLAPLQRQDYYAAYETNGLICGIGEFSVGTDGWAITAAPWWSSLSNTSAVILNTRVRGHVRVRNCGINLPINCFGNVVLQNATDDMGTEARCRIWGGIAGFGMAVPQPARIPSVHEIVLKQRSNTSEGGVQLEFGDSDASGTWIPAPDRFRKTIHTQTQLSGARGNPVYWGGNLSRLHPEALSLDDAEILSVAVSIGVAAERTHDSELDGLEARSKLVSVASSDFVGLSISPNFLGSRVKGQGGSGLFGQALPIKSSVLTKFLGTEALAEAVFDEAVAGFGSLDGKPVMVVDLRTAGGKLKIGGTEHSSGSVTFRLILSAPEVNPDGRIVTKLLRTQFSMDTLLGGCICLNHDAAGAPFETTIYTIAHLRPTLDVRFPACIEMDTDRFKPTNSRYQRISCPTPPPPGKGQIARDSRVSGVTLTIDLRKFAPELRAGRFVYSLPYTLAIENQPK
jgi:hypothetical protein